jgi:cytochrome c-type biogenesis protein CcmH/NrfG
MARKNRFFADNSCQTGQRRTRYALEMTTHMADDELEFRLARSQFFYDQAERKARAKARTQTVDKWADAIGRILTVILVVSLAIVAVVALPQILSILILLFVFNPVLPILLLLGLFVLLKVIVS